MTQFNSINKVLPIIALYAYTGYRLMPALQGIFNSVSEIRFALPSIDAMYKDFKNLKSFTYYSQNKDHLQFDNEITLRNINYDYPNANRTALKNLNLSIKSKTTVGIVGATGSGKTTTVDIILGLLEAQQGSLEIDGRQISKKNIRAWQKFIGYVPQNIFLADDTIAGNIALGVESKFINQKNVERAAKIANIHKFVIDDLPKQYSTTVGERGIRLSGGQRQRIGIARALYHNPKVLILDEATSALDNLTEQTVMEEVKNIGKDLTIIIIAHRLNTVKKCDNIFLLEKGELRGQGSFEELIKNNRKFREVSNL